MGIVHKDPNDPGPTTVKEIIARSICEIKNILLIWEGHDIECLDDNLENFRCKKCGAKFIRPDCPSRPPPLPPEPENYVI